MAVLGAATHDFISTGKVVDGAQLVMTQAAKIALWQSARRT
jgi:hypothetical protein